MSIEVLEIDKDLDQVVKLISAPVKDAEVVRRARERAELIRLQALEKYGVRNIAVELIHEARDRK